MINPPTRLDYGIQAMYGSTLSADDLVKTALDLLKCAARGEGAALEVRSSIFNMPYIKSGSNILEINGRALSAPYDVLRPNKATDYLNGGEGGGMIAPAP